jgi:hypothetical protein
MMSKNLKGKYIVTIYVCDYRWGMGWRIDLLTTYTHHSELQVIMLCIQVLGIYKI